MKDKHAKYVGNIVKVHRLNQREHEADLVGRVEGSSLFCLNFGCNTYYYSGDTLDIAVSRIKVAEMGYRIHNNLVSSTGFVNKNNIAKISIIKE